MENIKIFSKKKYSFMNSVTNKNNISKESISITLQNNLQYNLFIKDAMFITLFSVSL